jgi:hypothetical protein
MLGAIGDARMSIVLKHDHTAWPEHDRYQTARSRIQRQIYAKWAKTSATTIAASELFPAPTTWPVLTGTSLYVGRGATTVPLMSPDVYGYLRARVSMIADWKIGIVKIGRTRILKEDQKR